MASTSAHASLTKSQHNQVGGLVATGQPSRAAKVRSLVGRPDLTLKEVAAALGDGLVQSRFEEDRERFIEALLFGPSSEASRSLLMAPVVSALLARADVALADIPVSSPGTLSGKALEAFEEVGSVHRFVAEKIAFSGAGARGQHDPMSGIRDDAFRQAAVAYADHLKRNARHYRASGSRVLESLGVQARLSLVSLGRGVLRGHEIAALLELRGIERVVMERHGTLLVLDSRSNADRVAQAVALMERYGVLGEDVSAWVLSKVSTALLDGRSVVNRAPVVFGPEPELLPAEALWPGDVAGARVDRDLAEVALSVGWVIARRGLLADPALREQFNGIVERAAERGVAGYVATDLPATQVAPARPEGAGLVGATPELVLAHTLRLLMLDAPAVLDLAMIRRERGYSGPLEQVVAALSVLARERSAGFTLGVARGAEVGELPVTDVVLEAGRLVSCRIGAHAYTVTRDDGRLGLLVDGKATALAQLERFRLDPVALSSWDAGVFEIQPLFGAPRGATAGNGRFTLVAGEGSGGFDSVAFGPVAEDAIVRAEVSITATGGGILARASEGTTSFQGLAWFVEGGKATLVRVDGGAKALELGVIEHAPVEADGRYVLSLAVEGLAVTAAVGDRKLKAKLDSPLPPGRAGLLVRPAGRLEASALSVAPRSQ